MLFGIPIAVAHVISSLIVVPIAIYGISLISRMQLATQAIWLVLQFLPLVYIATRGSAAMLVHGARGLLRDPLARPARQHSRRGHRRVILHRDAAIVQRLGEDDTDGEDVRAIPLQAGRQILAKRIAPRRAKWLRWNS